MLSSRFHVRLLQDVFGWGIGLWLIGYVLGIIFFAVVPSSVLGWFVMPIGVLITVWVLLTRIHSGAPADYVLLGVVWTLLAIILDYVFIVRLFNPPDGYYKLDVYLYYALTFLLPLTVGWWKTSRFGLPLRGSAG